MSWHARLDLRYAREDDRTVVRASHSGPLRILQSLYPEGPGVCHNVLVHPPSGLVAGDTLEIEVDVAACAQALVTTPGAGRFYRSEGEPAIQHARLRLGDGARLEWLPLETIYYSGCQAENRLALDLAAGAELIGWDVAALGLPAAGRPFEQGSVLQDIALGDAWLERGRMDATDTLLMDGPLGLAGHRCLATLFLVTGTDMARERREQALTLARDCIGAQDQVLAGATSPHPRVVVVRAVAPLVEPAMALLKGIRNLWRPALWEQAACLPRTWAL